MEHGGGNNSTFTTRVVTSTGSDTYSVIAAALSSLKGPKHGGANIKVVQMIKDIKQNVKNLDDDEELRSYLIKILDKQAFDNAGLIYGMGHAVYSISDPRAKIFQGYAELLAKEKGRMKDYDLYRRIEEMAPALICERKHAFTGVSANIDFYSGFVYNMLGIPEELYTPLFAMARVVGWSAHRIEELVNSGKIIRPAYQSVMSERQYLPIEKRE
jgi:citrate synthase